MESNNLVLILLVGGILGIIGQGIRFVLGMTKGTLDSKTVKEKLLLSLFIGFIAGCLAIMIKNPLPNDIRLSNKELLFAIMSAGYAGADFIEGVLTAFKNKLSNPQQSQTNN